MSGLGVGSVMPNFSSITNGSGAIARKTSGVGGGTPPPRPARVTNQTFFRRRTFLYAT